MEPYYLATITKSDEQAAACVRGDGVYVIPGRRTLHDLLADWPVEIARLEKNLDDDSAEPDGAASETVFLPPVPNPPNLYMAGANYMDHMQEMRQRHTHPRIEKPKDGPFIFLKPTTTLIGHKHRMNISRDAHDVDWEVELAVIIGKRAYRVAAEDALGYVAGYTIVNDVSVRTGWKREEAEPAMTWDWLRQKGWRDSCPCGPWLLPTSFCPRPGNLAISLTVNGRIEQHSRTSEMVFSIEEQIEYLSHLLPLVPGDILSTGTCGGVGLSKGRFLSPGDVMVATVEGIGALETEVGLA